MPIYEYECLECGERFELRRSINDSDEELKCIRCGTGNLLRIFSAFATNVNSTCTPSSPS